MRTARPKINPGQEHYYYYYYYAPAPIGEGHYKMMTGVYLSVCLSVCRVPRPNSRTERARKPKIGIIEAHDTSNP